MEPFTLRTARFVLDQPTMTDVDDIAVYCSDPSFERYMTTPWPYEREHAEYFVHEYAVGGWERAEEWTFSIRERDEGPMLGAIGVRLTTGMLGFWLGAEHRGRGVMPEVVTVVIDAVFERTDHDLVLWECVEGNLSSMRVAEKTGFRYTGLRPGLIPARDGRPSESWTGQLRRHEDRLPKPGWPR